jgi:hypothetical protein
MAFKQTKSSKRIECGTCQSRMSPDTNMDGHITLDELLGRLRIHFGFHKHESGFKSRRHLVTFVHVHGRGASQIKEVIAVKPMSMLRPGRAKSRKLR